MRHSVVRNFAGSDSSQRPKTTSGVSPLLRTAISFSTFRPNCSVAL
ncbi:MAG TPA: hypothetical protein VMV69_30945 [Pirellulales bacterium]|nr:hypothetical protein [Pirellulales bacterium]